jgi:hypothetical protein
MVLLLLYLIILYYYTHTYTYIIIYYTLLSSVLSFPSFSSSPILLFLYPFDVVLGWKCVRRLMSNVRELFLGFDPACFIGVDG